MLTCQQPVNAAIPLILDSPHSGRFYPPDFVAVPPMEHLRRAEDAYVDELYQMAPQYGATLLCALFPRCYMDVNRAESDLDPSLLSGSWPRSLGFSDKTALGVGLIWKTIRDGVGGTLPLYDRLLSVAEVERRLRTCYHAYHETLQRLLDDHYGRFGCVWHINCHSMPAWGDVMSPDPGQKRADFVLGNRMGTSAGSEFTDLVREKLKRLGYTVAINVPFQGAELIRRYGNPAIDRHSLQIEINRRLYLDENTVTKLPEFSVLQNSLGELLKEIAAYVQAKIPTLAR